MPMVNTTPAKPGKVNVPSMSDIVPKIKSPFASNAKAATSPAVI